MSSSGVHYAIDHRTKKKRDRKLVIVRSEAH